MGRDEEAARLRISFRGHRGKGSGVCQREEGDLRANS